MAKFKVSDVRVNNNQFIVKTIMWLKSNVGPRTTGITCIGEDQGVFTDKVPGDGWNLYYYIDHVNEQMFQIEVEIDDDVKAVELALIIRDWL